MSGLFINSKSNCIHILHFLYFVKILHKTSILINYDVGVNVEQEISHKSWRAKTLTQRPPGQGGFQRGLLDHSAFGLSLEVAFQEALLAQTLAL